MSYTAIIIDDEPHARALLNNMLKTYCPEITVLDECKDLPNGVKSIRKHNPNLVFLDIEMPGHSGLELLDFFNDDEVEFSIIFTTAYNHYAIQAFKLSAIDYLLKPIEPEELENAVKRFMKQEIKHDFKELKNNLNPNTPTKIALPTNNLIKFVDLNQIMYFKADGSYTHVHLADNSSITVCKTLKNFEDMVSIPGSKFFRCHKSFLVNVDYITDMIKSDGGSLIINNTHQISLSSERSAELLNLLNVVKKN
ncbi:MAG: response regulator [Flavobacteriales bacterium]|nr:response regulator [Flavobacteriales bacterium]